MGYRDDFIQRLKDDGMWDQLTTEKKSFMESLDDQAAAAFMALSDEHEVNCQGRIDALRDPTSVSAHAETMRVLSDGIQNVNEVFGGTLVDWGTQRPTELGQHLIDFLQAARRSGFTLLEVQNALGSINFEALLLLQKLGAMRKAGDADQ